MEWNCEYGMATKLFHIWAVGVLKTVLQEVYCTIAICTQDPGALGVSYRYN